MPLQNIYSVKGFIYFDRPPIFADYGVSQLPNLAIYERVHFDKYCFEYLQKKKITQILAEETGGKSYKAHKYSLDSEIIQMDMLYHANMPP